MIEVEGFWLPDGEQHLIPYLIDGPRIHGGPTYQAHKWQAALPHCRGRSRYIDIGAHCGLWARPLAYEFWRVEAFEPVPAHVACLLRNVPENVTIHPLALGESVGRVAMCTEPGSSGDTRVDQGNTSGPNLVPLAPLDSYEFDEVDLIKIDAEGYEVFIVKGAERTIREHRPCIVVEQKPGHGVRYGRNDKAALTLLQKWGARIEWEIGGDFCLTFP